MRRWISIFAVILTTLSLLGCNASSPDTAGVAAGTPSLQGDGQPLSVVSRADRDSVIAEGTIEPARAGYLSFEIPGEVTDVWVENKQHVELGASLVRLDTRELVLALRSAEQDVLAQEAALQRLLNGASDKIVHRADKGNADQIALAEVALRARQLQLEKAQAEDPEIGVTAARAKVKQIELNVQQTRAQDPTPAVTAAEVSLERAHIALADTQDEYDRSLDRPWEDQGIRDAWSKRLKQAQLDYKAAQAQLDNALNAQEAHTVGLSILSAQVEEARTQLAGALVAQVTYSTTLDILAEDVEAARLQLRALETWDNPYRDEAAKEDVAQAQAMLEKTRIAVERLQLRLEDAELAAPFAGTVVDVQVKVGDQVNPGQAVVVLATLDQLQVHTTDLTELDVGGIALAQPARVTVDALPEQELVGQVHEIALYGQDYRGDTVYKVVIKLDTPQQVPGLRWGMTTMVEIDARRDP